MKLLSRTTIILLFFLLYNNFLSQTKRFFYETNYQIDTIGTKANDVLVLQINNDGNIYFLSDQYIKNDSINNTLIGSKQYVSPNFNMILKYFTNGDSKYIFHRKLSNKYYSYEIKNKIDWKLTKDKKKIGKFTVQKATAEYGGRNWEAWFTREIPLPYGPYIFNGLPGLILEVYDAAKNFTFSFIRNKSFKENINIDIQNFFDDKVIKIKKEDWKRVQINFYENPLYENKVEGWAMYHSDGREFSPSDYRGLEIKAKKYIKLYNNPIELSEKIDYK